MIWSWLLPLLLIYNVIVFAIYAYDKWRAKRNEWRVPERTLLLLAAAFGGLGAMMGVFQLRHKSQKPKFTLTVPVMTAAQGFLLFWGRTRGWW